MQPKEGRKELAPREIKFRYRRLDTAIRERAGSSQERRKRAKDTIMRVGAATYGVGGGGVKERGMEVEREGGGQYQALPKGMFPTAG